MISNNVRIFLKQRIGEKGVTMIEYALIAALIAVVAVAVLTDVGTALISKFTEIKNKLN